MKRTLHSAGALAAAAAAVGLVRAARDRRAQAGASQAHEPATAQPDEARPELDEIAQPAPVRDPMIQGTLGQLGIHL